MALPKYTNQSVAALEYPILSMLAEGESYIFKDKTRFDGFRTASSTVITEDIKSKLFIEVLEATYASANPLQIQVSEIQEWQNIIQRINALEKVFGLLHDLTTEELKKFDAAVKRRPLFK